MQKLQKYKNLFHVHNSKYTFTLRLNPSILISFNRQLQGSV